MSAISLSVYELLVRDREAAYARCSEADSAAALLPRFAAVGLLGMGAYAAALGLLHHMDHTTFYAEQPMAYASKVFLAYAGSFFGTNIAALPTFYFHTLVAGIRTHGWRVSVEVMRAQATQATVMLGLLPLYFALGVGLLQLELDQTWTALRGMGFVLPFLCGLPGSYHLAGTFFRLARENPPVAPAQRSSAPLLLTLAWCALFAIMAPVGVIGIWHLL